MRERAARGACGARAQPLAADPTVGFDMWQTLEFFSQLWDFRAHWI
jgi:hypothetical protein